MNRGTARAQGFLARNWPWTIAAGLLAVILVFSLIAGSGFGGSSGSGGSADDAAAGGSDGDAAAGEAAAANGQEFDLSRRIDDDPTALGETDAPVVLIEFADYRCPFCAKFHRDTLGDLVSDYVDDGRMRVEWRDAPVFGEESALAAVAARAAGEQGMFWDFQHAVFGDAPDSGHPDLPREVLIEHAKAAGVEDLERFEADLDNEALHDAVQSDFEEAQRLGVTSVPTFAINDSVISGAQPAEVFRETIEKELAEAGH